MNINIRFGKANYKRLKPFLLAVDQQEDRHFRFTAGADYMPLSIEYLGYCDAHGHPVYSMMHYYIQNGDLMRDPDMVFSVNDAAGSICPLSFQQDGIGAWGTVYREAFRKTAQGLNYSPRTLHDLDSFLNSWSKNILAQGFDAAQPFRTAERRGTIPD